MSSELTPLAAAKSEYEEQTEGLFDFDPPPPVRDGAAEYLLQLTGVRFQDDSGDPWSFWALAPPDRRWALLAENVARDRDRGWISGVEHVWLTQGPRVQQALVDVHTGAILRRRPHPTRRATPTEGQHP